MSFIVNYFSDGGRSMNVQDTVLNDCTSVEKSAMIHCKLNEFPGHCIKRKSKKVSSSHSNCSSVAVAMGECER